MADKITFEWALGTKNVSAKHILNLNMYSRYAGLVAGIVLNLILLLVLKRRPKVYYILFIIHILVAAYLYYLIYVDQNYIFIPYIKSNFDF